MYQTRQLFLDNLNNFISSCKTSISNVLEELDWSWESIYSGSQKEQNLEDVKSISAIGLNIPDEVGCLNTSTHQLESDGHGTYNTGNLLHHFVSSDPIYKELVESLSKPAPTKQDEKSRAEILAEMLKMERDAKRRRINYKNRVHTKNKSHLEIMREVLAEQMSTLTQQIEGDTSSVSTKEEEPKKNNSTEELIEISFPKDGNPYTAWKEVLVMKPTAYKNLDERTHFENKHFDSRSSHHRNRNYNYPTFKESNHLNHKKDNKQRNSSYSEERPHYKYSIKRPDKERSDKYHRSRYDEERLHSKYRYSGSSRQEERRPDSKIKHSRHEERLDSNDDQSRQDRQLQSKYSRSKHYEEHSDSTSYDYGYERVHSHGSEDLKSDASSDEDYKHTSKCSTDNEGFSPKRRKEHTSHTEKHKSSKKHKRDRSHSSSPKSHKSKKHKSKHRKRH